MYLMVSMAALLLGPADPGAGPDREAATSPPSVYHGNWRVLAADDAGGQATMRIDIQHSPGEREGTGSYALYQPFCDLIAGGRITGASDCDLMDQGGEMAVRADGRRMVITFAPTADGAEHRLTFRRSGRSLTGTYRNADLVRAVRLERAPE
ncbi:hypothetical protein [Sphingomonas sp.]|uniref:hypothetical protein n=1 Tax=Sphingomonas sp. TaxID=28214 RepID=UPI002DD6A807|nr:hypothetical protein [Sphingomonas sp.]